MPQDKRQKSDRRARELSRGYLFHHRKKDTVLNDFLYCSQLFAGGIWFNDSSAVCLETIISQICKANQNQSAKNLTFFH
jgi:hypothetical protein